MTYTPNPTWVDGKDGTLITADALNNMESGIIAANSLVSDFALQVSGMWVTTLAQQSANTWTPNPTRPIITPIWLEAGAFDRVAILVRTAGPAGQFWTTALYSTAGELLYEATPVDVSSTGVKEVGINWTIAKTGKFYLVGRLTGVTTSVAALNRADPHPWQVPVTSDMQYTPAGGIWFNYPNTDPLPATGLFARQLSVMNFAPALRLRRA